MPTTKRQLSCFMALSPDIPGEPAPEQSVVLQFCVAPGGGVLLTLPPRVQWCVN